MLRPIVPPDLIRDTANDGSGGRGAEVEDAVTTDRRPKPVVPLLLVSAGGGVHEIQTFAHYVGNTQPSGRAGLPFLSRCLLRYFYID
jgi:hypothetical protein